MVGALRSSPVSPGTFQVPEDVRFYLSFNQKVCSLQNNLDGAVSYVWGRATLPRGPDRLALLLQPPHGGCM